MSTLQKIESEIQTLSRAEVEALRRWIEDYLEDQLELTDEFKEQIAASEKSMREGTGRVHVGGS